MRFVVTELEGYPVGGRPELGVDYYVVDTRWNRRIVATYRSEEWGRASARYLAHLHADRLNEELAAA